MKKVIVVFYSLTWFTKKIAEMISDFCDWKLLELKPENDITNKWFMKYLRWWKQVMMKEKPKLKKFDSDFTLYDTIFIWTPVWAFTFTPAIRSFLDMVKLKNKKIVLFCTHEGQCGKTLEAMEGKIRYSGHLYPSVRFVATSSSALLDSLWSPKRSFRSLGEDKVISKKDFNRKEYEWKDEMLRKEVEKRLKNLDQIL